jgi:hypothetical protein
MAANIGTRLTISDCSVEGVSDLREGRSLSVGFRGKSLQQLHLQGWFSPYMSIETPVNRAGYAIAHPDKADHQ